MTRQKHGTAFGAAKGLSALAAIAAASYGTYVGLAWLKYGHPERPDGEEADDLLDRFIPEYDVVDRHAITVAAPAALTFDALMDLRLDDSAVVRGIFKAREVLLGAESASPGESRTLVDATKALGWVRLAERQGREIVMGAVTKPWEANVIFRGIPPEKFADFGEPGYVKIVWTLRADALDDERSIARTETRAVATDEVARRRFRWYWARFSPGISLIRSMMQRRIKKAAEERAQVLRGSSTETVVPPASGTVI